MTLESEHTRDYAAEALKVQRTEERNARRTKLSAKDAIALGVLDGSYQRYLLGE